LARAGVAAIAKISDAPKTNFFIILISCFVALASQVVFNSRRAIDGDA
jgi:hypothetical protein